MQQDFDLIINETRYRVAVPAECKWQPVILYCSTDIYIDTFSCVTVMICPCMSAIRSVCAVLYDALLRWNVVSISCSSHCVLIAPVSEHCMGLHTSKEVVL